MSGYTHKERESIKFSLYRLGVVDNLIQQINPEPFVVPYNPYFYLR